MSYCPFCGEPFDEQPDTCPFCNADLKAVSSDAGVGEPDPSEGQGPAHASEPPMTSEPSAAPVPVPSPAGAPEPPATAIPAPVGTAATPDVSGAPPEAPAQPAGTSPRRKRIIIAAVAAVAVVVVALGGYALYDHHRTTVYADSLALLEQGDYAAALEGFNSLGDYEASQERAQYCEQGVTYQDAEALLAAGDYSAAREAFASLGGFQDAESRVEACDAWLAFEQARDLAAQGKYEEALDVAKRFRSVPEVRNDAEVSKWRNETGYSYAEALLADGLFYSAYMAFSDLGDYSDAATRRDACVQDMPASSELYHNGGFVSSSTDITFDAATARRPTYLKMYSGSELVSTVFVNPGTQATIQVPPGVYAFKKAQGDEWFGEQEMFGDDGVYQLLLFDGGNEVTNIEGNSIYAITLDYQGAGNVGDRNVDAGTF